MSHHPFIVSHQPDAAAAMRKSIGPLSLRREELRQCQPDATIIHRLRLNIANDWPTLRRLMNVADAASFDVIAMTFQRAEGGGEIILEVNDNGEGDPDATARSLAAADGVTLIGWDMHMHQPAPHHRAAQGDKTTPMPAR